MDSNHPQINFGKTGVLLINLGTPDSTGWWDIRKYLNEFLSDRRVIEVNPIIWKVILNLFILTFGHLKRHMLIKKFGEKKLMSPRFCILPEVKPKNLIPKSETKI